MFDFGQEAVQWLCAPQGEPLNGWHMALRAAVVYCIAVMLVRIGKKRFLAKPSPFDLVLALMLGSVLSRAITGNAPFLPTIIAGFVLILMHTAFSILTFYSAQIGAVIKGQPVILIKDGEIHWENLRKSQITQRDLVSALRRNAQITNSADVKMAILERNGEISVIPKERQPRIIEFDVEQGVQKIRLEISKE